MERAAMDIMFEDDEEDEGLHRASLERRSKVYCGRNASCRRVQKMQMMVTSDDVDQIWQAAICHLLSAVCGGE